MSLKTLDATEVETFYTADELARIKKEAEEGETLAEKTTRELFDDLNETFAQKTGNIILSRHESWQSTTEHLETFPSDKFDSPEGLYEYIRHKWGSGNFRIQGRIAGRKGFAMNRMITIGKTVEEMLEEKKNKQLPMVVPQNSDDRMLLMLMEQNRRSDERMAEMMRVMMQRDQQKESPFAHLMTPEITAAIVTGAMGLISTMMTRPKESPAEQMLAMIKLTKELKGEDSEEKNSNLMDAVGAIAGGLVKGMTEAKSEPRRLASAPEPSAAAALSAAQKWDAENVADFIENLHRGGATFDDSHVAAIKEHIAGDWSIVANAFVIMDDDVYDALKPEIMRRFQIPAPMVKAIEERRAESIAESPEME